MGCAIKRKVDMGSPLGHKHTSCIFTEYREIQLGCTHLENFGVGFQPNHRSCSCSTQLQGDQMDNENRDFLQKEIDVA